MGLLDILCEEVHFFGCASDFPHLCFFKFSFFSGHWSNNNVFFILFFISTFHRRRNPFVDPQPAQPQTNIP